MSVRFNMRDFIGRHSQLHHVRGVTYRTMYDKTHRKSRIEVNISRDIMRDAGWYVGVYVDVEFDTCRMYLVRKERGMYKVRTTHYKQNCHPQIAVPGRFVGSIFMAYKPETKLPMATIRHYCDDVRIGNKVISFRLPESNIRVNSLRGQHEL